MKSNPGSRVENLLRRTREAVEDSGREINEIVTFTKEKIHKLRDELIEIKARLANVIVLVDKLDSELDALRKKSSSFDLVLGPNSAESKEVYAQIKDVQHAVETARNTEFELRTRRNNIERYLKENGELLKRSEKVLDQVMLAVNHLQLEDVESTDFSVLRIIEAQESEKKRLSRDIHDGPAQSLVNIMLKAEYAEKIIDRSPQLLQKELRDIQIAVRDTLVDIRRIIFDLSPYSMEGYGLIQTLKSMIKSDKINFNLEVVENALIASSVIENNIFRIIQEIYSNIIKHSRAKNARILLEIGKEEIVIEADDDGRGFDVEEERDGYGHLNIRDRVELLNGEFVLKSIVGEGTNIKIVIPNSSGYEKNIHNR